jgi:LysM repeat protein
MRRTLIGAVAVVALVAGCGGSGHKGSSPPTTVPTASTIPPPPTTTTIPAVTYRVKPGDTLTAIAARYHVPVDDIMAANKLANADQLTAGQVLDIPPAPPRQLTASPAQGPPGAAFELKVAGAQPGDDQIHDHVSARHIHGWSPRCVDRRRSQRGVPDESRGDGGQLHRRGRGQPGHDADHPLPRRCRAAPHVTAGACRSPGA